jgi:ribosome biogenesis GTPase A
MEEEFSKMASKGLSRRPIRVLVVGVPNVGKSTLINRLVGQNKAGVGSKAGFTKQLSWIRVNKNIELLDSPGILWPKFEDQKEAHILASLSSIKDEVVDSFQLSSFIIRTMYELYPKQLEERYGITSISEDLIEEYDLIAKRRGALKKGGLTDYDKVSNIVIQDLQNGRLGKVTFDDISNL